MCQTLLHNIKFNMKTFIEYREWVLSVLQSIGPFTVKLCNSAEEDNL